MDTCTCSTSQLMTDCTAVSQSGPSGRGQMVMKLLERLTELRKARKQQKSDSIKAAETKYRRSDDFFRDKGGHAGNVS